MFVNRASRLQRLLRTFATKDSEIKISMTSAVKELLDVDNLNPCLLKADYAVRGAIAVKSQEYQKALKEGADLPFSKILACNIGELVSLIQRPL